MLDSAIYNKLINTSAVTNLVDDRIWPVRPDIDPDLAFVVYAAEVTDRPLNLDGPSGLRIYDVAVGCFSKDYDSLRPVEEAVLTALDGYRSGATQGIFFYGRPDTIEADPFIYHSILQFRGYYSV